MAKMGRHLALTALLLLCLFALSAAADPATMGVSVGWIPTPSRCSGSIAECLEGDEFALDSEVYRRILATSKYISYGALKRNTVPCSVRGASYYNCRPGAQSNPYTRGCSRIARCRS